MSSVAAALRQRERLIAICADDEEFAASTR
jgi:hypothetical protein